MSLIWLCNSCGGRYTDPTPDGFNYVHACPPEIRDKDGKLIPTPNPRNEETAFSRQRLELGIVAEGSGVTCVTDPRLKESPRISELKDRVAKREAGNDY